jgi:hypothetical protein
LLFVALIAAIFIGLFAKIGAVDAFLNKKKLEVRDALAGVKGKNTYTLPKTVFAISPVSEKGYEGGDAGPGGGTNLASADGQNGDGSGADGSDAAGGKGSGKGGKGGGKGGAGSGAGGAGGAAGAAKPPALTGPNVGTDGGAGGGAGTGEGTGKGRTSGGEGGRTDDSEYRRKYNEGDENYEELREQKETVRKREEEKFYYDRGGDKEKEATKISAKKKGKLDALMEEAAAEKDREDKSGDLFGGVLKYIIIALIVLFLLFILIKSRQK